MSDLVFPKSLLYLWVLESRNVYVTFLVDIGAQRSQRGPSSSRGTYHLDPVRHSCRWSEKERDLLEREHGTVEEDGVTGSTLVSPMSWEYLSSPFRGSESSK